MKEKILLIVIGILLLLDFFILLNMPSKAKAESQPQIIAPSIALSAGEKGVVYFYDGANLWFSNDYGEQWRKIK